MSGQGRSQDASAGVTRTADEQEKLARKQRLIDHLAGIFDIDKAWIDAPMPLGRWDAEAVECPRVVWLYWHQGWNDAPDVVRLCRDSWQAFNPDYEVRAIDYAWVQATYGDRLPFQQKIGVAGFSDRLRSTLLREHGGVWSDATIFCSAPLDAWIHMLLTPARFFAFSDPAEERALGTWFLAAMPGSPLVGAWDDVLRVYLKDRDDANRTMHAYFFSHYIFEFIVTSSPVMRAWWEAVPKVAIAAALALSRFADLASRETEVRPFGEEDRARMRELLSLSPIHRLTWKRTVAAGLPNATMTLEVLAEHIERAATTR